MLRHIHLRPYIVHALIAAILYCIPVTIFLQKAMFEQAWLLYLGNFLFLIVITLFLFSFNKKRNQNAGALAMLTAGNITTILGVLISCLLVLILLIIFVPGLFAYGMAAKTLKDAPANTVRDKTNGLNFMIFANAIIGNISTGAFVSIIYPFALKGDQTKEKVPRKQAEL